MAEMRCMAGTVALDGEIDPEKGCEVRVSSFRDEDRTGDIVPSLSISLQNIGKDGVCFCIDGYANIDALRHYCEMTLDHFKAGVLW